MEKWIFLSYFLDEKTPTYGNGKPFKYEVVNSIQQGDSCNSAQWTLSNHMGTHIDCPFHFSNIGKKLTEYTADFWIFNKIQFLDISPVSPGTIINPIQISFKNILPDIELLIIKTGFCHYRNKPIYWNKNPGFSPEFAHYLRSNFNRLRAIGFDSISVSSWTNRALGRKTHKAFLEHDQPILLIEDMDLSSIKNDTIFLQVIVSPLQVNNTDASPCTILGKKG